MSIALLTLHTHNLWGYCRYSLTNKQRYCAKHGIDLINTVGRLGDGDRRPPSWSKVRLMQMALPYYDWAIWLDADAYILDLGCKPAAFVSDDPEIHMRLTNDHLTGHYYQGGVWAVRNTERASQMLREIYAQTDLIQNPYWEQGALNRLCFQQPGWSQAISLLEPRTRFNLLPTGQVKESELEQMVIAHLAGTANDVRTQAFAQLEAAFQAQGDVPLGKQLKEGPLGRCMRLKFV